MHLLLLVWTIPIKYLLLQYCCINYINYFEVLGMNDVEAGLVLICKYY